MQQPSQMIPVMPSFPPTNITTEQIQKYLDENKKLILAILDNQNLGKLAECAQYQAQLQKNLMYLAAIADAQPQAAPTMPGPGPQMAGAPHPAMQQQGGGGGGGFYMQQQQQHPHAAAAAMGGGSQQQQPNIFPAKMMSPPLQFNNNNNPHQMMQQQQQQIHAHQQAMLQGHMATSTRPSNGIGIGMPHHPEPSFGGGATSKQDAAAAADAGGANRQNSGGGDGESS